MACSHRQVFLVRAIVKALCRFALGTRAPQVSGVKVVRSAATGGADADDVALDVEFVWGGNPVSAPAA